MTTHDTAGTARGGMTMDDDVTRLRALLERAEDGLWEVDAVDPFLVTTNNPSKGATSHIAQVVCPMDEDGDPYEANAALIVAAVNALPGLLDRVERAEARVAELSRG